MTVTATVLPDGSVTVVDGAMTFSPLSPDAVAAIVEQAAASANAHKTQALTDVLTTLAQLITSAGVVAGPAAYAQVTVIPGAASAVLDQASFDLVTKNLPGSADGNGGWVVGPLTISQQVPPTPAPVTP